MDWYVWGGETQKTFTTFTPFTTRPDLGSIVPAPEPPRIATGDLARARV